MGGNHHIHGHTNASALLEKTRQDARAPWRGGLLIHGVQILRQH